MCMTVYVCVCMCVCVCVCVCVRVCECILCHSSFIISCNPPIRHIIYYSTDVNNTNHMEE